MQSAMWRSLLGVLLLSMIWVGTGCDKVNETRARRIANKAVKAMRMEQYSKARALLKQSIVLAPRNPHFYYLLGRVYEATSDLMKAEQQYKRSAHIGKSYKPHFQLGGIYMQWKRYAQSSKSYEQAVALQKKKHPKHHYTVYQLGLSYHKQKRFALAAAQLNKAITIKPNFIDAYNNLATVYYDQAEKARLELGDDQAVPHYNKAIAVVQRAKAAGVANEQTYNVLGLAYQKQKKFQEAINAFDQATKVKPYFSISAFNRGATYDMWLEEMINKATETKDRKEIKQFMAKGAIYRDAAIKAFKKFLQLHQGHQGTRVSVREKIMKLKLMREKEMHKRIKRERRKKRKLRRRR
jgi:tetratricopeptide (TPR) repeat protein